MRKPERTMVRFASVLLGVASGGAADAFRPPPGFQVAPTTCEVQRRGDRRPSPPATSPRARRIRLSPSDDENRLDAALAEEIDAFDAGLAMEIEESLSLARDALAVGIEAAGAPSEEDIDEIANMLLEMPPAPPQEAPPLSVVSRGLDETVDEGDASEDKDFLEAVGEKFGGEMEKIQKLIFGGEMEMPPAPPEEAPPLSVVSRGLDEAVDEGDALEDKTFLEAMREKLGGEMERIQKLIFEAEEELAETESSIKKAEDAAAALKNEIEESTREREAMVKKIESEFDKENELLVAQMKIASDELKVVMDQSEKNITEVRSKAARDEKALMARVDSIKAAIDEVTAETIEINKDKERLQRSNRSKLDKLAQEGKNRLARFARAWQFDIDYAKQANADLVRQAEEAERKVQAVFDQITQMRTERVSLQRQIAEAETNALGEIEKLQQEMKSNDEQYAIALQKERDRMDEVIDAAYQAYAIKICKRIVERQAAEADYQEKLRLVNVQIIAAREKQEARVKEYLDKLEEEHKKERVLIYQEKIEAVSKMREQMNKELAIENGKIEETHKTNRAKIESVRKEAADLKAAFKKEIAKKRKLAKEEEKELLGQLEDVKVDMADKRKAQQRMYEEQRSAYVADMNAKISESKMGLRQKWADLAVVKESYVEARAERDDMLDEVAEKQALIDSYTNDRESFRKSLRLTAKVAREKISSKTRGLLKRVRLRDDGDWQ